MKALRRVAVAALSGLCVLAVAMGPLSDPIAQAEGSVSLSDAKKKLAELRSETNAIEKKMRHCEDQMNEALVQQALLQDDIEEQQELIDELIPEFALVVNAERQTQKWQYTVGFLLADDSSQFIDHMGTSDAVWTIWNEKMERLADEKTQLDDLNISLEDAIGEIKVQLAEQKKLLKKLAAAEAEAKALVLTLTYAQRQAWASASRTVKPHTLHVIKLITGMHPKIKTVYTLRAGSRGDHGYGRAADFMIPNYRSKSSITMGWAIAHYLQHNARELGVQYVIYQQKIWNISRASEGWRRMGGRGNDTANHYDHVHVSMKS